MYGRKEATEENILSRITEYDIFRYYITGFKSLNVPFRSELSKDNNPSCAIQLYNGKLLYKDFREPGAMSCFGYVMKRYNITYSEALALINRDFSLNLVSRNSSRLGSIVQKEIVLHGRDYLKDGELHKQLRVQVRQWNRTHDKLYWYDQYGLGVEDLKFFDIYPIRFLWIFNGVEWSEMAAAPVSYGYYGGLNPSNEQLWKVYQPYEKMKWLSNFTSDHIQGWKQLPESGDLLIITKALKDVAVLRKAGYPSIAPNAELTLISQSKMDALKDRFKNIVVLYDNDKVGRLGSDKLGNLYGLKSIFLPEDKAKDPSDYVAGFGYDSLKYQLKDLIKCGE